MRTGSYFQWACEKKAGRREAKKSKRARTMKVKKLKVGLKLWKTRQPNAKGQGGAVRDGKQTAQRREPPKREAKNREGKFILETRGPHGNNLKGGGAERLSTSTSLELAGMQENEAGRAGWLPLRKNQRNRQKIQVEHRWREERQLRQKRQSPGTPTKRL